MLQRPSFGTTWLPLGLATVALVILNLGLYTRLASQPAPPRFEFPYNEDFSALSVDEYEAFGGDWAIRDESLVQLSTSGYDLISFVPIAIAPEQNYRFEATLRYLGGAMGGGLMFNGQQTTSRQKSHMVRFNVDGDELWLIYGYFGDDSDFIGQGSTPIASAIDNAEPYRLQIQVQDDTYGISLNDAPLVRDVPLEYFGGSVGFISATSQVAFDDVHVYSDAEVVENVEAPVEEVIVEQAPVEQIAETIPMLETSLLNLNVEAGSSLWQPLSGDWRFENDAYVQYQVDGFDLSTIYQQALTYPLTLSATFQHRQNVGGGVLFNLPAPDNKNGGHMVRYFEDGSVIAWGYFDANGVFNGQGSVGVNLPGDTAQTLTIRAGNASYAIDLNGVEIAAGIPLINPVTSGYVGLTASQSTVAFNTVGIGNEVNPVDEQVANINTELANGDWIVEGGTITQTNTAASDFIAGTGLAGERFTISVDITLPADNPEAGAGIVFHMDGRDDQRGGYLVRFGSGGQELFWGNYDSEGNFTGEGGVPLSLPAGQRAQLLLTVREENFDIVVNGETLIESIPLERDSGWIGLVSFGGPVSFNNVNLQLGE